MEATNGYANGYSKGGKATALNGHAGKPAWRSRSSKGPTIISRLISITARLFTWYAIITLLFRCPSTLEECDATSPKICAPYFHAKHAISPHLEPYYDTYAAPYVDVVKPYYDTASEHVIAPAKIYFDKYGSPVLRYTQSFAEGQWQKNVQPQLAAYQKAGAEKFNQTIAPHLEQLSSALGPYYDIARANAQQTYEELLLPTYSFVRPYALQAYLYTSVFTTDTAIPYAYWAWNKTYIFLDHVVWPHVRALYAETVEPQLARIGKRLGRYKDKASKVSVETTATATSSESLSSKSSSFAKPTSSSASSSSSKVASSSEKSKSNSKSKSKGSSSKSSAASSSTVVETTHIPAAEEIAQHESSGHVEAPPPGENESEKRKTAREEVAADLESWQNKFAQAADESAAEIEERIEEISFNMIEKNVRKKGKSLVTTLQEVAKSKVDTLQQDVIGIVQRYTEHNDKAVAEEEVVKAIRVVGLAVKEKAQNIRDWKGSFEADMEAAITEAAESHFKILHSIRDLALQRIGMKWAWMDGVTYKDWAKYHELRDRFDEWTNDLKQLIITHPALDETRAASGEIEDSGMAVAQAAAQELSRLKQVAMWKLAAGDVSDNFDSDSMRSAAEAAEQAREEAAAEAAAAEAAEEEEEAERASQAAEEATAAAAASESPEAESSDHEEPVSDENIPVDDTSNETEDSSEAANPPESGASETHIGGDAKAEDAAATATATAYESIIIEYRRRYSSVGTEDNEADGQPGLASTDILGSDQSFTAVEDTEPSSASDDTMPSETPSEIPEAQVEEQPEEEIIPESVEDRPVSAPTGTVKPAFFGAAAQEVPDRGGPILDDKEEEESTFDALSEKAQSAYSNALAQASQKYSIAMSAVSAQVYGTPEPEPVKNQMFASVSAAYSAALDSANSRFSDALDAASKGVYGTPTQTATPTFVDWAHVESLAAQRFQEGRMWAEEQYSAAKIAIGLATATPTPTSNQLLEQAKHRYYAGLGAAHARYSDFMAAASSAMSSLAATATATPTDVAGAATSVASKATKKAGDVISGAEEDSLSMASAIREGVNVVASVVGDSVNSAAQEVIDAAHAVEQGVADTWEAIIARISGQVYEAPTPTPTAWYDNAYQDVEKFAAQASEQAAKQYEIVYNIVQELVVGKDASTSQSILARLQAAYATGAASAAAYLSEATSSAQAAAKAVKEGLQPPRDEL